MDIFRQNIIKLLNQISSENTYKISNKIITIIDNIDNDHINYYITFIDIIFSKCVNENENLYIRIYCNLCYKIIKHILSKDKDSFMIFYRYLIYKCQNIFEMDITLQNINNLKGCSILIAYLINKNLILRSLLTNILTELLNSSDERKLDMLGNLIKGLDDVSDIDPHIISIITTKSTLDYSTIRYNVLLEDILEQINN